MNSIKISSESCCAVIFANVGNDRMGDNAFREFVKRTLGIVDYNDKSAMGRRYTRAEIDNFNMITLKEIVGEI